jgi:ornithine cyclodeaminase
VISLNEDNPQAGRPMVQGFVTLFEHATGNLLTIIEGAEITAIRTAAASGLATRYLARTDAKTHAIFGTGVQAVTHIDAIAAVRSIEEVIIWGRDDDKASKLASDQAARTGLNIRATDDPQEAAQCDIISTVTGTTEPILLGDWVRPGCHINLVGSHSPAMREADGDLIARSEIYTDLLESLFNEGGDIVIPMNEGLIAKSDIKGEIGNVIDGSLEGRTNDTQITVYKSLGITAQDLFAAWSIYTNALKLGKGTDIPFD